MSIKIEQGKAYKHRDVGRKAIVNGYAGTGKVISVMGRTVEVEMPYGKVAVDRDKISLLTE